MKIGGESVLEKNYGKVTLTRGEKSYELLISPLPMGFAVKMRAVGILEYPKPPRKVVTDPKTGLHVKEGGRVATEEDRNDPLYILETASVSQRFAAVQLREVLRDCSDVLFETVEPDPSCVDKDVWRAYAEALVKEITQCGLTEQEQEKILEKAYELSNSVDLEKAAEAF